jgi:hypothetical protein
MKWGTGRGNLTEHLSQAACGLIELHATKSQSGLQVYISHALNLDISELHLPTALRPEPIRQKAGWVPESLRTVWITEKFLPLPENQTSIPRSFLQFR